MMDRPARTDRIPARLDTAWLLASALIVGFLLWWLRDFYHDDAYIALRYARNLMLGNGLVWNPGEPVEGYTSLAWVLLCAALGHVGMDLEFASRLLGVGALAGLFLYLARRGGTAGSATCALLAGCGGLVAWSMGGLETLLFTTLLTVCLVETRRFIDDPIDTVDAVSRGRAVRLGLLFGVLELTRPEGLLFLLLALPWSLVGGGRRGANWRRMLPLLAGFLVVFLPRCLFRILFYGEVVPNTFFVKVPAGLPTTAQGLIYLGEAVLAVPALAVAPFLVRWRRQGHGPGAGALFMGGSILAYLAYIVWIGGDHMPWHRMIVPILPAIGFGIAVALRAAGGRRFAVTIALLCGLNLAATLIAANRQDGLWRRRDPAAMGGRLVGLHIRQAWPADALVALNTAGSTAYFSERRAIDMLGLNDRHIAHRRNVPRLEELPWTRLPGHGKGDGDYVLGRKPDFIILGGSEGYREPWFLSDWEIIRNPEFSRDYAVQEVPIRPIPGGPEMLFIYFRRIAPR